jgi:CRP-like cAMP-binding protein
MVIDNQKVNKEVEVKPGDVVIMQGHPVNSLNLLHTGVLEILFTDQETAGKPKEEILKNSYRIGTLNGDFSFAEHGLVHGTPEICTFRCVQEAKISSYPFTKEQVLALSRSNPNLSLYILKSLYRKIHLQMERVAAVNKVLRDALVFEDNLLVTMGDAMAKAPDVAAFKTIIQNARSASMLFAKNKGAPMTAGDASFLMADHSQQLEKDYSANLADVKTLVDMDLISFVMNFLKIEGPILSAQMTNLPGLFKFPLENLTLVLDVLNQAVFEQTRQVLECGERIAGSQGLSGLWVTMPQNLLTSSPLANEVVTSKILEKLNEFQSFENQMRAVPRQGIQARVQTLFSQLAQVGRSATAAMAQNQAAVPAEIREKLASLRDSVTQILDYSRMPDEERATFVKLLANFKALSDKLDISPEARRARLQISRAYWNLYYYCFLRSQEDPAGVPLPVDLMFRFGFLDETMLSENNILFLLTCRDDYSGTMDIHSIRQWLEKVSSEEKAPSITEMGLTFEKNLREEEKSKTYAEMQELTQNPENMRKYRISFEINQMITSCARVCSDSVSTACPILINEIMNMDINKVFLYRQQIEDILQEIMRIDYQVFNREVLVKTKFRMEIVEKGVTPDFIILPTVGSRFMMWQELEGTNKRSKARFAIPQFFLGDLRKNMILALGRFRWEICKTQKGPQWADPIEGGLTGSYFDYISFYKKNPNLSEEAKERVDEHVKSFRSNRERFAQDYMVYIEFESKGIAKMNKVLRDIFYRAIPFSKPIRDKLKSLPVYEPLETRFNNVLNRRLKEVEVKLRKYEKDPEGVPQELAEYMEMMKK